MGCTDARDVSYTLEEERRLNLLYHVTHEFSGVKLRRSTKTVSSIDGVSGDLTVSNIGLLSFGTILDLKMSLNETTYSAIHEQVKWHSHESHR